MTTNNKTPRNEAPVVVDKLTKTVEGYDFECTTRSHGKTRTLTCRAMHGALYAKPTGSGLNYVKVCDLRLPLTQRRVIATLQGACAIYLAQEADGLEALYWLAARELEAIAEANKFKAMDADAIWEQKGQTVGVAYSLLVYPDGAPGPAAQHGIWEHVKAIFERARGYNPALGPVLAVNNKGLDEAYDLFLDQALLAKSIGAQQQALAF